MRLSAAVLIVSLRPTLRVSSALRQSGGRDTHQFVSAARRRSCSARRRIVRVNSQTAEKLERGRSSVASLFDGGAYSRTACNLRQAQRGSRDLLLHCHTQPRRPTANAHRHSPRRRPCLLCTATNPAPQSARGYSASRIQASRTSHAANYPCHSAYARANEQCIWRKRNRLGSGAVRSLWRQRSVRPEAQRSEEQAMVA